MTVQLHVARADTHGTHATGRVKWKTEEKLRIVVDAAGLEGDALGELLRHEGVHEADLAEWRRVVLSALGPIAKAPSGSEDLGRIRELERELLRKDKALAETAALLVLKKSPGVLGERGRRHEEGDRQVILELLEEAVIAGARRDRACATIGFCARTVARWRVEDGGKDRRREAGATPAHKLSEAERGAIVAHAISPECRDLSPRQVIDVSSRKVIAYGVYATESATLAAELVE